MDPRITPARADLAAEFLRGKVAAPRFTTAHEMTVSVPWLDLYDKPGGHVTSQLLYGDRFDVYEQAPWFAWGQNKRDGYVGYVVANRLHEPGPAANCRVSTNWAQIYPRPNVKMPIDRPPLPFMATLHSREIVGEFAHVDGGFCPIQALVPLDRRVADFVSVAERFAGVPYLWGGCTPLGFDCSGLVQIALLAAGKFAPRDADQQESVLGVALAAGESLQRGDLIFWDGHVGIMQSSTETVHANAHHMAVVSEPLKTVSDRVLANGLVVRSRRRIVA